ncbi:glycosyltransferase family 39 protein [Thiomicrorhabdus sp. 6S3-12]|uniref:ArnT family glycosyltransferase n=1 Tax=Thiomicrorhabdus sp. 6S3-12 TaxID=2819681 RepID=UPI001AAC62F4|nr:glycosyltransferase family 39 protein [Thiomicrorhabdus sp. 6S3-12]MBO1923734.1 glycosyltransferase family 39 protein [Thiomicrorhabdus sp. 6S3-12]
MQNQLDLKAKITLLAFLFFTINQITQYLVSGTADYDQAEQLLASQYLLLGYGPQPPLYSWLIYPVAQVFGPSLFATGAIKVGILTLMVWTILQIGEFFKLSSKQLVVAVIAMALIPQYVFESQRDLSHSSLSGLMALLILWQTLRVTRDASLTNYLLLGIAVGLGMMSKYNIVLFVSALILTILLSKHRAILFNKYLIVSILAALVVFLPHALWMLDHLQAATSGTNKLQMGESSGLIQSLGATLMAGLVFLSPLWLFALTLLINKKDQGENLIEKDDKNLLLTLFFFVWLILIIFVIASGAQHVKDRWFHPLLPFVPILLAMTINPSDRAYKTFRNIGIFFLAVMMFVLPMRTPLAQYTEKVSRPNLPFPEQLTHIKSQLETEPAVVFADSYVLAGNLRIYFPDAAISNGSKYVDMVNHKGTLLLVCESENCKENRFADWLQKRNIDVTKLTYKSHTTEYKFLPGIKHTIYWTTLEGNWKN